MLSLKSFFSCNPFGVHLRECRAGEQWMAEGELMCASAALRDICAFCVAPVTTRNRKENSTDSRSFRREQDSQMGRAREEGQHVCVAMLGLQCVV